MSDARCSAASEGALPEWEEPRVQTVYELLCAHLVPPGDEHWEGFVARHIVRALSSDGEPSNGKQPLMASRPAPPVPSDHTFHDAQPEQQPVAWQWWYDRLSKWCSLANDTPECRASLEKGGYRLRPLYAARPPAAPVEFDTLAGARKQAMKDHASMLPAAPVETDRDPLMGLVASLAAAISLLERTPKSKKAAPSDKMFDQMLTDYRKALEAGRDFVRTYRDAYEHGYNDGVEWAQTHPQSSAETDRHDRDGQTCATCGRTSNGEG